MFMAGVRGPRSRHRSAIWARSAGNMPPFFGVHPSETLRKEPPTMPRRFIALTSLAAGATIAVTVALASPALAKGATQASITGPGLAHPVTVSVAAGSEALPEQGDALSSLADQTGLFTV